MNYFTHNSSVFHVVNALKILKCDTTAFAARCISRTKHEPQMFLFKSWTAGCDTED